MIVFPFVFFSIILISLLRKRRKFDLASYVAFLYVVTSFFAILIDKFELRNSLVANYEISFETTFVYCLLLGLFLSPIIRYTRGNDTMLCPLENQTILNFFSISSFVFFSITLFFSFQQIVDVLNGDMAALRLAVNAGQNDDAWFQSMPSILKQPIVCCNMIFSNFWVLQFLSFFCWLIQKMNLKYAFFFFTVSLFGPLWGILNIDRSKVTYWIIALIANYFLFNNYMTKKHKRLFWIFSSICIAFLFVYLSNMTEARFGEITRANGLTGSVGGVISYLGQPFIHFSFLYDCFVNHNTTLAMFFPFTYKFVFGEFGTGVLVQQYLTNTYQMQLGIFFSFLGIPYLSNLSFSN